MRAGRNTAQGLAAAAGAGLLTAAMAARFGFSDDALATLRTALNLSAFGVFSFNRSERVLTLDHPLWTAIEAPLVAGLRDYPAAIALLAGACVALAAWLVLRRADPLKAFPVAALLGCFPAFAGGLGSGGEAPLAILLLSALADRMDRSDQAESASGANREVLLASLLFLAKFSSVLLVLPCLLHRLLRAPGRRGVLTGLAPAGAWVVGAWFYFGGLLPHSLHGDLPPALAGPALRLDSVALLAFAARWPLAGALLAWALLKAVLAFRPGRTRGVADWLGLGLGLGLIHSFFSGAAGWSPSAVAILAWTAFLVLAYDRAMAGGFVALLAACLALSLSRPGALGRLPGPGGLAKVSAWPSRVEWRLLGSAPEAQRVIVLTAVPGQAGLARGPAAYVLDGFALGDPFWSAANRAARASIEGARRAPPGRPGSVPAQFRRSELRSALTLELRLKPRPSGTLEPLLAAGEARNADLYSVRYLDHGRIYLAVAKYETGATLFSRVIGPVDFSRTHRLTIKFGREAEAGLTAENLIIWDGQLVKEIAWPYRVRRFAPWEISCGWNTAASPDATSWFSGDILRMAPADPRVLAPFLPQPVQPRDLEVRLRIRPAADEPGGQPLLVTGREFAGDAFSLWKVDPGHVRVGHDHWGAIDWGPALAFDFSREHEADILALNRGYAGRLAAPLILVRLDRQVVLFERQALSPFRPEQAFPLEDPLQMSSCGQFFEGSARVIWAGPPSPEDGQALRGQWDYLRHAWGRLELTALFDEAAPPGLGEALVETGRTGRGDILYVVRDGPGRFHFGFDHWGIGGSVGPSVPIDPALPHRMTVEMASLLAPGDRTGEASRTVRVTVDDQVVFRADSPCHPAEASELYLAANRLGASTTGRGFSGLILEARRL